MELRQLEMLLAVVDCGTYQKAGETLHVSHSAIHRQVRLLEHELQDRILVRAGKYVRLTEVGSRIVVLARRVQQEILEVRGQIGDANHLRTGLLRVGTGNSILNLFLPPVLERFRREFPGVEVRIKTGTGDEVAHEVLSGSLDMGITYSPADTLPGDPTPKYELLYRDELVLAVGKKHPLAKRAAVSLAEAISFPFILFPKSSHIRRLIDRLFVAEGMTPRVVMELDNEEAIQKMVAINMGIAFFSKARALSNQVHHVRLRGHRIYSDVGFIFPQASYIPPPVREFARVCREASSTARTGTSVK
jgi:LysR family transcriptional regulator, cyn operon transcriptional activator